VTIPQRSCALVGRLLASIGSHGVALGEYLLYPCDCHPGRSRNAGATRVRPRSRNDRRVALANDVLKRHACSVVAAADRAQGRQLGTHRSVATGHRANYNRYRNLLASRDNAKCPRTRCNGPGADTEGVSFDAT